MKIEAGKCYRTRDGLKVTVYAVNLRGEYCVFGIIHGPHQDIPETWTSSGSVAKVCEAQHDLVAPWVDEPTMDLSALPAWATHVWFGGVWWYYDNETQRCQIPPAYSPKQSVPVGSRYRIDREANRLVLEEGGAK